MNSTLADKVKDLDSIGTTKQLAYIIVNGNDSNGWNVLLHDGSGDKSEPYSVNNISRQDLAQAYVNKLKAHFINFEMVEALPVVLQKNPTYIDDTILNLYFKGWGESNDKIIKRILSTGGLVWKYIHNSFYFYVSVETFDDVMAKVKNINIKNGAVIRASDINFASGTEDEIRDTIQMQIRKLIDKRKSLE